MDRSWLKPVGPGFYVDINRHIYFDVREFIAAYNLHDTPEVRQQIWEEVRNDFGTLGVIDLTES
jgi:hypothetical protein